MELTADDLYQMIGKREAELFLLRRRLAELEAALASASQPHEHPATSEPLATSAPGS